MRSFFSKQFDDFILLLKGAADIGRIIQVFFFFSSFFFLYRYVNHFLNIVDNS